MGTQLQGVIVFDRRFELLRCMTLSLRGAKLHADPWRVSTMIIRGVAITTIGVSAHAETGVRHFDIPPQTVTSALNEFARQADITLVFSSTLVARETSAGVRGDFTISDALIRILNGTGLSFRKINDSTIAINLTAELLTSNNPNVGDSGAAQMPTEGKQLNESKNMSHPGVLSRVGGFIALIGSALSGGAAHAQASSTAPEVQAADSLEEIIVSASRIQRTGFTSPTPVTTLDATQIAATGASNIADVLNQVPSFRPSITSTSADSRAFSPGASYADLRGLGSIRTLVLVSGERFVPQVPIFANATTNQVDLNVIPTIAIQRAEVITGGASAAWGSDAVAGVTNLQLYKNYDGLKLDAAYGISDEGDDRNTAISFLGGTSFLDDRAHLVVAGSWDQNQGAGDIFTRRWGKNAPYVLANAACTGCWLSGTGYQRATFAPGGLITTTTLRGIAFGPGGQPYTLPPGSFVSGSGMFDGGVPNNYPSAGVYLKAPLSRKTLYSYFDFKLTDSVTAHASVNYADLHVTPDTVALQNTYTILSGNPYIPAPIQSAMTTGNIPSFRLGVYHADIGNGRIDQDVNQVTKRASVGLDWDIGGSWKADLYYAYGDNMDRLKFSGVVNLTKAAQAADAILSGGRIVCRNQANSCVPINLFGSGSGSAAAVDFITDDAFSNVGYVQQAGALNLRGDPFDTWAGAVSLATGIEYRKETQDNASDSLQSTNQLQGIANTNFHASLDVKEAYLETVIPLAKGLPFIKQLDFNGAVRAARYSQSGQANTWKLGLTWDVSDDLLLRVTRSRDFRAPNLTELFFPEFLASSTLPVPGQATFPNYYNGGYAKLKPEVALSTVAGFTYRPSFVPGLSTSVDFYRINLTDVIAGANAANIVTACNEGYAPACAQIVRANGLITEIHGVFSNISAVKVKGVDAELSYATSLSGLGLPGSLVLRALGTYTDDLSYQALPGNPFINFSGQVAAGLTFRTQFFAPRFRGAFSAGYRLDKFAGALVANFISASRDDVTLTDTQFAQNRISSYINWDLNSSYSFGKRDQFQVYGTVKNLFDKDPPMAVNPFLFIPTNPAFYDTIGRTYKIGLRYTF